MTTFRSTSVGLALLLLANLQAGAAPLHRGVSSLTPGQERTQPLSFACARCHNAEFALWVGHPHSHSLIDAAVTPERILPQWRENEPGWAQVGAGRFHRGDVALAIGQLQLQVFFRADSDGHRLLPGQWNVKNGSWEPLAESFEQLRGAYRTWEEECIGCHSTRVELLEVAPGARAGEAGVGCPACHGDGEEHMAKGGLGPIVNPAKLSPELRSQICAACHARGISAQGGRPYSVGFLPGQPLADAFTVASPGEGQEALFWPDGVERRAWMEYQGFVQSGHHRVGISCTTCHATHGSDHERSLRRNASKLCSGCHAESAPRPAAHARHPGGKAGCVDCHMPLVNGDSREPHVHSHTFRFLPPSAEEDSHRPSSCTSRCHPGREPGWTARTLEEWQRTGSGN